MFTQPPGTGDASGLLSAVICAVIINGWCIKESQTALAYLSKMILLYRYYTLGAADNLGVTDAHLRILL